MNIVVKMTLIIDVWEYDFIFNLFSRNFKKNLKTIFSIPKYPFKELKVYKCNKFKNFKLKKLLGRVGDMGHDTGNFLKNLNVYHKYGKIFWI